jgi:hypothetical protein
MLSAASLWRVFIMVQRWLSPQSSFLVTPQYQMVCAPDKALRPFYEVSGVIRGGMY